MQDSGFSVHGSRFRIQGSGCRVQGSGFTVQDSGLRVWGVGFDLFPAWKTMTFRPPSARCVRDCLEFGVQGVGFILLHITICVGDIEANV